MTGTQATLARVLLADGTLVTTPAMPEDGLIPSLLATSDVLGTGWDAADTARVQPGSTVVVVGDGAVGLLSRLAKASIRKPISPDMQACSRSTPSMDEWARRTA